jgi:hypothetical protein
MSMVLTSQESHGFQIAQLPADISDAFSNPSGRFPDIDPILRIGHEEVQESHSNIRRKEFLQNLIIPHGFIFTTIVL